VKEERFREEQQLIIKSLNKLPSLKTKKRENEKLENSLSRD
jgi:hypothetical protein